LINIKNDITEANTLPSEFYHTEKYFNLCRDIIYPKSWQLISDDNKLKLKNDAQPVSFVDGFIDEPLLLINTDEGINCFSNVCTHRGNLLIENNCSIIRDIVCKYHGRRFSSCGKFLSMPETNGMKNFPSENDNLHQIPVDQWKQFIFSSLDPKIDFSLLINEMEARVGWMPIENFIFEPNSSRDYLVKANWALYCDNYLEGFHIPFVHKDLAKTLDYSAYKSELFSYSNLQLGIASGGEYCFDLPKDSIDYGKDIAAYYFWVFPNMMFNFYPWGLSLNIIKPINPKLTKVEFRTYIWDESKLEHGAGSILDKVEREDEDIVENVQLGVKSRFYKSGRYSPKMEKGVHHFHRLISDFLT
jgi:choline monooxygenase